MKTDYFYVMLAPVVSLIWLAAPLEAQFAGTDNISAYTISSDGALTPIADSPFPAGSKPDSVVVDSKAKFLYVANGGGSNNVSAYSIGSNGALTPIPGSPFPAGSLPSSVVIDPTSNFAYVVNESGGNGPSAGDRLDRDVLGVAGLRYVVWLEGINDLGACLVSGDDVIKGFKDVVERLHAKKVKVIGATVVSSFGSPIASYGFLKIDTERKKVNDFIRAGGLFDAVADFDAATLDPVTGAMKASMQPNQTTRGPGELLHPNRVGYQAMAETIDLKLLAPSLGE